MMLKRSVCLTVAATLTMLAKPQAGDLAAGEAESAAEARPPVVLTDEARKLHKSSLLIDGHNDLPWELRTQAQGRFDRLDIAQRQPKLHTDIPRLREGGVSAQFWSV